MTSRESLEDPLPRRGLLSRRVVLRGALGLSMAAFIAACGGDDDDESDDPSSTTEAGAGEPTATGAASDEPSATEGETGDSTATSAGAEAGFPATLEHKYGSTTIEREPERVISLGYVDHDAILAMGVIPVALAADDYSADQPYGVWPWAQEALGEGQPEVLSPFEFDFERIAALEPDLIVAVYAGLTEEEYATLSEIAPTVAQSGGYGDYQTPWDEMTRTIGRALGKPGQAEDLIDGVAEQFVAAREEHPEFEGKAAVYAGLLGSGQYYAEGGESTRTAILRALGFTIPAEFTGFYVEVSQEQVNLFDHDVLLWELGDVESQEIIESNELYQQLDVAQDGRDIFIVDPLIAGGLALISVLSLPFVIDQLVPLLAAALEEDGQESGGDAFPVTLEHKYGSTTIESKPERVVSVGYNDQDAILALGVQPLAVHYWYGEEPFAVFPWAQPLLGDAEPLVLGEGGGELDFEAIAALEPDLIIGVYSGMTEDEYGTLSRIAPTVPQPGNYIDYGVPWQEMTTIIGQALGYETEAAGLVEDVEAQFADARAAHPEWEGQSFVIGAPDGAGQFGFVASQDPRSRIIQSLGFVMPEEFDEIAGEQFYGTVSVERADLLDQDVIVFFQLDWVPGGREAIESDPLLSHLEALQDGRAVYIAGDLDSALAFGSVLSLPYFLEEIITRLEIATDGDPETVVP